MTTKPAQVMVVTPHPDDAEYGVAGTVARWVGEGKEVICVVCTNGDKGTIDANMAPEEVVDGLAERGVLLLGRELGRFRAVTHYWISDEDIKATIAAMRATLA